MNAKNLIAALAVSACAAGAYAAEAPQLTFFNTGAPYEVTAQNSAASSGSTVQAKNAGASEQALPALNFANSAEPSAVTAQSPATPAQNRR